MSLPDSIDRGDIKYTLPKVLAERCGYDDPNSVTRAARFHKIQTITHDKRKYINEQQFLDYCQSKVEKLEESEDGGSLKDQCDLLQKYNSQLLQSLKKERAKTELIIEACQTSISKMNIKPVPVPKVETKKHDLEFHALRSDEQAGEVVDPTRVQGVSEYNFSIYEERLKVWAEKVALFKEQDSDSLGLNKLVIARLGDHVEGERIFQGQAFHIDRPTVDQMFDALALEFTTMQMLAGIFPKIEIFCVPGNHGRLGKKGEHHEKNNWDYILNRILQLMLKDQPNIKMYVSNDPVMIVQHGNFRFLYKHGDNINSYNGIPYYGLERDFNRLASLYEMIINFECIGHFHTQSNIKDNILMNGCFPGGSELSVGRMVRSSRPSQKIFYFDPENGINRETNLHLAPKPKLQADQNRIYTSYI